MTSMKISNFLTPSLPCRIHDHATYQYSCPLFDYPLTPLKAFTWLRDFLPIFPKIAVRQSVGGCGAAEGNSKPCRPFSPTQ